VANPGRYVAAGSSILLRRSVRNALAPSGAGLLASRDAGRAAAGRAGSFNSGKNACRRLHSVFKFDHEILSVKVTLPFNLRVKCRNVKSLSLEDDYSNIHIHSVLHTSFIDLRYPTTSQV
jgi:hypothetical protein